MRLFASILLVAISQTLTAGTEPGGPIPGTAGTSGSTGNAGADYVIGLSPFLDNSVKDEVYRRLVRLVVQDLPLDSTLSIYDAFDLKSVTRLTMPNARAFNSPKTRANQFAPAIGELKRFLAKDHPKPRHPGLSFDGAIRLPQFCDFLADNLPAAGSPLTVLLIGSPLYQDVKEPAFSMVDGYFPSDGHLRASREQSVYGYSAGNNAARPLTVHWFYSGDPWISELHKEKINRFWGLYLERGGGQLTTFCGDLPTALKAFGAGAALDRLPARRWAVDPHENKIEMLRIGRSVEVANWLTRDALPNLTQRPPKVMIGPMKIGIRWKYNIDLDLYGTPHPGAETLFFQHPRSPQGYYYKDHRSSPGREYEFIEFESPVDIREVEAYVNFYKGSCPEGPKGEVRIEFDGRVYGAVFSIPATEGNRGHSASDQQDFWTRIPVQQILKIGPTENAAR
ncbi:MAG TPA: hypothetical protein VJA21_06465 [Verrucomicrobiae bacterium]